jgi:glycosyltransferase involved in cell wall biosynthesis
MPRMNAPGHRIVYVIDDLGHGGAQRQLYLTARALAGEARVTVVSLSGTVEPYARRLRELGTAVVVIPRRGHLEAARVRALVAAVAAADATVVHGFLDASNAYAFLAARARRIPAALSLRSDRLRVTGPRAAVLRWMLRRSDAVTVNSEAGRDHLLHAVGVDAARVHLVGNIVETATAPAGPTGAVIGCVGRLVDVKRFETVIEALPAVRESIPEARLVIVGDGPCRARLEATAARLGVTPLVTFTGATEDAVTRIAGFGCLVVASEHEGLTNAALEALSLGVPVVAVPAGDLPRVVRDGATGLIAADGSPAAIAAAVTTVLRSPSLRETAAREGPALVRERFSAESARRTLLDLYARLARN